MITGIKHGALASEMGSGRGQRACVRTGVETGRVVGNCCWWLVKMGLTLICEDDSHMEDRKSI